MEKPGRRDFLSHAFKGTIIGLLGFFSGSIFHRKTAFSAAKMMGLDDDSLESVLKRVTKDNLYSELNAADLSPEEKLAIAAVKEVSNRDLSRLLDTWKVEEGESTAMGSGNTCGDGCGGSCGNVCGHGCSPPIDGFAVVDQKGKLNIDMQNLDKSRFKNFLKKAIRLK